MTLTTTQRHNIKALALCAGYAFVLLFLLSPYSYLRDVFFNGDSAWFFMCGKAWMNGMMPYVDFSDSKGPLLWLIFGLGYLLNHHSYVGVFWISVLFYTATLYIAYKLSRLFVGKGQACLCALLMALGIFSFGHTQMHAEDFCHPFVLFSLYSLCRVIGDCNTSKRLLFWLNVGMGVSFMACLLIKWNIACMIGSLMLAAFILSFRRKTSGISIAGMVSGAIAFALPFLIYFLCFADLSAMIREYFVNTFLTMDGRTSIFDVLTFDMRMLRSESRTIVLLLCVLLFTWKYKQYFWLPICFILFRLCLAGGGAAYYYNILMTFSLFGCIVIVEFIFTRLHILQRNLPACCLTVALLTIVCNIGRINAAHQQVDIDRQAYYKIGYIMSQVKQPKSFWYIGFYGPGVLVDELPACRYWGLQRGATEEMIEERAHVLEARIPDFVFAYYGCSPEQSKDHAMLTSYGYTLYSTITCPYNKSVLYALYGRPGLHLPPDDFYVSQWDVWLKRNIFGI